jgi:AcrR family transcriptional regulator
MTGLREQKKRQTRDAIIEEAGRLFAKQGFQSTTMDEISAGAGVSAGTLYNYFGTKTTLLLAHLESRVADMTETGAALLADPPPDVVSAVQHLLGSYLDRFMSLEPDLLRELIAAGFSTRSEILPELIRLDELLLDQLGALLSHYAETGQLDPEVEVSEATIALYSLFATQLIMYAGVEAMTAAALRRAVARHIQIAFTGLLAHER